MLRNYIAAALRNLVRNRLYAAINIVGLAAGFAAALLIALFVRDELTYDRWIQGHEHIYRISSYTVIAGIKQQQDITLFGAADALKQDFPEIEAVTQLSCCEDISGFRNGDIEAAERFRWADPNLFDVLPLPVVAGDLRSSLAEPNSIVLTRSLARKYFGNDAPLGQTIEVNRKHLMRVTAVLDDLPSNSHLDIGALASIRTLNPETARAEIDASYVYIRLAPGVSVDGLRQALPAFNERHPEFTKVRASYWLDAIVPIADIHLQPASHLAMKPSGDSGAIYNAIAIAVLIVIVASINFVNLTTARASRRAVEVGVRKAAGATQRQFVAQFIGESVFYAALGMTAALAIASLALPFFNAFLGRTVGLNLTGDPVLPMTLIAIVALVGSAAGAYPAVVLSQCSPARVLKGGPQTRAAHKKGRQILIAAQFAVLIVLALASAAITRQTRYMSTQALRLDTDQMLILNGGLLGACDPALITAVQALAGVQGATCITGPILGAPNVNMNVDAPDGTRAKSQFLLVDFGSFELYGLHPLAGRFFSRNYGGDAPPLDGKIDLGNAVVINESLARQLGFSTPQSAIGQIIRFSPTIARTATEKRPDAVTEIVGVAPDFGASRNLKENVPPRLFFIEPDYARHGSMHVKLTGDKIPETLSAIDAVWRKLGPQKPIERAFLDQTIEEMYREYARLGETVAVFAAVAVFISSLGLFGLAALTTEQRTKEIGVRKSMGASGADITRLMLWDFSKPVLWGSLIAWPVGYLIMRRWLENFADRIDIGLWMFPLASSLALVIALLTVAGHVLLIARAEPVKALRYE